MILTAIVTAEILFWLLLISGLLVRYALKAPRVGVALLIATPVVDLALLALTYVDLSFGGSASFFHGLSALYIGYSVALGATIIQSLDKRFAHRFGQHESGDVNSEVSNYEKALSTWRRACIASLISIILLILGIVITGLHGAFWLIYWVIVAVFVVPMWWCLGPRREKKLCLNCSGFRCTS